MDPISAIGLAGTIVQLAEIAGQALIKLFQYYVEVKEAGTRAMELREEFGFTLSQLTALSEELKVDGYAHPSIDTSQLQLALTRFDQVLQRINKRTQRAVVGPVERLKWPFRKEENASLISEIERCKSTFSLALNLLQRYVSKSNLLMCSSTIASSRRPIYELEISYGW